MDGPCYTVLGIMCMVRDCSTGYIRLELNTILGQISGSRPITRKRCHQWVVVGCMPATSWEGQASRGVMKGGRGNFRPWYYGPLIDGPVYESLADSPKSVPISCLTLILCTRYILLQWVGCTWPLSSLHGAFCLHRWETGALWRDVGSVSSFISSSLVYMKASYLEKLQYMHLLS